MAEDYNGNDLKFVQDMIPHHELAVKMAAKVLQDGMAKDLTGIANDIIDSQTKQINFLKKWLTDRGEKPKSGSKMHM